MSKLLWLFCTCFGTIFAESSSLVGDDNPDAHLSTPEIIVRHGYPAETHTIVTQDGYILSIHRIPDGKNSLGSSKEGRKQPVFIQHGLLSSSADWVVTANKSLAFILADLGFDVWLGNARGNTYSRAHVNLSTDDQEFWNFSFYEMGIYDLPAAIEYISRYTNRGGEIIYIGHSMGTSMFYVYSSALQKHSNLIKAMVSLAPVAYMTDIRSPIKYLAPWINNVEWLAKHLGLAEFLPNDKIIKFLSHIICDENHFERNVCENIIFILCGFDRDQFDDRFLPVILGHSPAGASTKTVIHYAQLIKNGGEFRQYDYGSKENTKRYNSTVPPAFALKKITVPVYLMYGDNDWLAGPKDVLKLSQTLQNKIGVYHIPLPAFNHVDFIWAKDAPTLVYKPMLQALKKYIYT